MTKIVSQLPDNEKPDWMQAMMIAEDALKEEDREWAAAKLHQCRVEVGRWELPMVGGPADGLPRKEGVLAATMATYGTVIEQVFVVWEHRHIAWHTGRQVWEVYVEDSITGQQLYLFQTTSLQRAKEDSIEHYLAAHAVAPFRVPTASDMCHEHVKLVCSQELHARREI